MHYHTQRDNEVKTGLIPASGAGHFLRNRIRHNRAPPNTKMAG